MKTVGFHNTLLNQELRIETKLFSLKYGPILSHEYH